LKRTIGLFAGDGELPVEIARRLSGEGNPAVAFSFREDTKPLRKWTSEVIKVDRPAIGKIVKDLEARGIRDLILAGLVPKKLIYRADLMDDDLRNMISILGSRDDHAILDAVVSFFGSRGIRVLPYREIVPDMLAREGAIAGRPLRPEEEDDIRYGLRIAASLVPMSFGQTVVVKSRSVVSVEAMEGTDAAIERAGAISRGGVVVKMMRPDQDERFDIPVIGPGTLETMHEAGIVCLAVEAGRTIVLGGELFRERAEEWEIAVTGVIPAPSS
jgi:hypothetical protein